MARTIDAENASYTATQLDLDQWKAAMAAQRDADFSRLNTQVCILFIGSTLSLVRD